MCVQALPLILSAVGTGLQVKNQQDQAKAQQQALADRIRLSTAAQEQASARVAQQTQAIKNDTGESDRAAETSDFMDALRRAKAADAPTGPAGATNARFDQDAAAAAGAQSAESAKYAGNLARIDVPMFRNLRDQRGFNDTAIDLSRIGSQMGGQDFLSQLRAAQAGNPGLDAAGQFLTAYGQAAAQRAPKTPAPNPYYQTILPGGDNWSSGPGWIRPGQTIVSPWPGYLQGRG